MCRVRLQIPLSVQSCPVRVCQGFSMLELLITVSVVAILSGLVVPGFSSMWLDSQRTTAVNGFVQRVPLARSTAAHRGRTVTICRSDDGQSCSHRTDGWQAGWMVFVNSDDDQPPERDPNETILAVFNTWPGGTISSNRTAYSFRPYIHRIVNGSVVFCDRRGASQARAVIINSAGRPRVSSRDGSNQPLRCPTG
ncbi:MAG: GspH/FimT family pseudopilin [Steroidobacter sp.]